MAQQTTPDQQEELRKKLENMSPDELKEFQKKQCIFCHIISGKAAAKKVYEDEKVVAILDINPANPGHILLMPREHYMIMPQMPDDEMSHIFIVAKQLSNALLRALDVRGTNIIVANGPAAGQKAQHFMIHIIPRKEQNDLSFTLPSNVQAENELDAVAEKVTNKFNELIGIKQKEKTAEDILHEKVKNKAPSSDKTEKKIIDADFKEEKAKTTEEKKEGEDEEKEEKKEGEDEEEEGKKEERDKREDDGNKDIDFEAIARVLNAR